MKVPPEVAVDSVKQTIVLLKDWYRIDMRDAKSSPMKEWLEGRARGYKTAVDCLRMDLYRQEPKRRTP